MTEKHHLEDSRDGFATRTWALWFFTLPIRYLIRRVWLTKKNGMAKIIMLANTFLVDRLGSLFRTKRLH
jgi:hypothetical protein